MNMTHHPPLAPITKCVGGKRQLIGEIIPRIPPDFEAYVEPFLGGATVLLALQPERAVVGDLNEELVIFYRVVRDHPDELIEELRGLHVDAETFYALRNIDRDPEAFNQLTDVARAARYLFLNKTAFNGLWRVNKAGQMNAPFGSGTPNICDELSIRAVSQYLSENNVIIVHRDVEEVLKLTMPGDFVYLDPPYTPVSETANFTAYTAGGFSTVDQLRLKAACDDLTKRGVRFMLSNSDTEFTRNLYDDFLVETVQARRSINCKGSKRGPVNELLVRNYGEVHHGCP